MRTDILKLHVTAEQLRQLEEQCEGREGLTKVHKLLLKHLIMDHRKAIDLLDRLNIEMEEPA